MKKNVLSVIIAVFIVLLTHNSVQAKSRWKNICPDSTVLYCDNVNKDAYNNDTNPPLLRGVKLGKIIGVSWRLKGSIVSISDAIPEAGIPKSVRKAPKDAYYYIIDDSWGEDKSFLRECSEIEAR